MRTSRTPEKPAAVWVAIDAITPWEQNPRRNDAAAAEVAKSITRFGFGSPILVREADGVVIAGHTRLKAAQQLGMDKVLVRYMDLDPAEARALALADNKLSELAEWDDAMLAEVLRDLAAEDVDVEGLGFDAEALDAALQPLPDIDLDSLDDGTGHLAGESDYMIWRMSTRKDEEQEISDALASDWGDPEAPTGKAERLGALFLHLWRTYGR